MSGRTGGGTRRPSRDYEIITSFTGLGALTGARALAEIGDDRSRFADARSLKAYAGSAPITRASQPLGHPPAGEEQPPGRCRVHLGVRGRHPLTRASRLYYRRREHGDRHAAALRNVFNRLIGCLFHCLQAGQTYNEATAFPVPSKEPETLAA